MNSTNNRVIRRTATSARTEIQDLLVSLLSSELLAPSREIWLLSPWLRDLPLFDNCAAAFRGLAPEWARREMSLLEVLATIVQRGAHLILLTRPEEENRRAVERLLALVGSDAAERIRTEFRAGLHTKVMVGDDYCLTGSMNFTWSGIEENDETVTFSTDPERVGALRLELREQHGASE